MTAYTITSNAGADMGTYQADDEAGALDAMSRDAGYESQADAVARGIVPFAGTVVAVTVLAHDGGPTRRKSTRGERCDAGAFTRTAEALHAAGTCRTRSLSAPDGCLRVSRNPPQSSDPRPAEWAEVRFILAGRS